LKQKGKKQMAKVRKVRRVAVEAAPAAPEPAPVEENTFDPGLGSTEFETSTEIDQIAAALVEFRKDCPNPQKDRQAHNYSYVSLANIIENTQELLYAQGLALTQFPIAAQGGLGVISLLVHTSGQYFRSRFVMPIPALSGTNATQDAGAAITYARRYAASGILFIASDEDTDADYERTPATRRKRRG
jgi:hypothetical protein